MTTTRAQLVEALLAFRARDRAEAATAWREEITRRVQEIETHSVDLEDEPTAMKRQRERARQRLERRRS